MTVCRVCHRPLRSPESIALGAGPVCVPRLAASRPSCHPTLPGMPRPLATIDQDAPTVAGATPGPSSHPARPQEADPRQVALPWVQPEPGCLPARQGAAILRLRGVEVSVEELEGESPQGTLERLFAAFMAAFTKIGDGE